MRHTTACSDTVYGFTVATDEETCKIEDVRCLFNVLSTGFCADPPPRCTGHTTDPVTERTENLRLFFKHRFRILRVATITPVVTNACDHTTPLNVFVNDDCGFKFRMNRFLNEHRDTLFTSDTFLFTVCKRRCADINCVQILFVVHGPIVGISVSAKFFGTCLRTVFRNIAHRTKFDIFKVIFEVVHVRASHATGSDKTEFHFIHVFSLKMGIPKSLSFTAIV